jgi:hypothetical protein
MQLALSCLSLFIFKVSALNSSLHPENVNDSKVNETIRININDGQNSYPEPVSAFDAKAAEICYRSWEGWWESRTKSTRPAWQLCNASTKPEPSDYVLYSGTTYFKTIGTVGPGTTYTTCDSITRFRFSANASVTTSAVNVTLVQHGWELRNRTTECTSYPESPSSSKRPRCGMPESYCNDLWTSYLLKVSSFTETEPFQTVPGLPLSPCGAQAVCHLDLQQEIVLLYWPLKLVDRDICAADGIGSGRTISTTNFPINSSQPVVKTISQISFRGGNLYRLSWVSGHVTRTWNDPIVTPSVMTGSWELTSPNIYIAHRPITGYRFSRQDGGGLTRATTRKTTYIVRESGIFVLKSEDLYSRRPLLFKSSGPEEARRIASGLWRPEFGTLVSGEDIKYETNKFDFGHLQSPVPAVVYMEARSDCWGEQTHCGTLTDDSYRPQLLIRNHVWRSMLSDQYVCELPTVFDPPIALQTIDVGSELIAPEFPTEVAVFPTPTPTLTAPPLRGEIPVQSAKLAPASPISRPWLENGQMTHPTKSPQFGKGFTKGNPANVQSSGMGDSGSGMGKPFEVGANRHSPNRVQWQQNDHGGDPANRNPLHDTDNRHKVMGNRVGSDHSGDTRNEHKGAVGIGNQLDSSTNTEKQNIWATDTLEPNPLARKKNVAVRNFEILRHLGYLPLLVTFYSFFF